MDLEAFCELVAQFLNVFPADQEPKPIFQEEYDEFYDALHDGEPKEDRDKEWADALWVWLLIGHYHKVDMQKAMTAVGYSNFLKIKHRHLFKKDPETGKWIKPDNWKKMIADGEIT